MSGYSNFVQGNGNVLPDVNNPGCVNQEANKEDFVLFTKGSINSDQATVDINITQSMGVGQYITDNMHGCGCELKDARDVQLSQPMINFEGGKGWIGEKGCLVDTDTALRKNDDCLTNKRYINQLDERLHLTTGNFSRGYHDVNVESIIQSGTLASDDRSCNSLTGVTIGNYFTPMIPKLRGEIQDTKYLIPEDSMDSWVRGGLPSRQMARNEDYLRRCQEKTFA